MRSPSRQLRKKLSAITCVAILAVVTTVAAQEPVPEDSVLSPADTSSPRATLNTFLSNVEALAAVIDDDAIEQGEYQALRRAAETLDFSAMPSAESFTMQIERVALLKELLDRVELPDPADIPNAEAIAEDELRFWSIPGTRIRLVRIDSGRREGQFLFSAGTVEALDRLYRVAEDLPYQSDATQGLYDAVTTDPSSIFVVEKHVRDRLQPVNTASPRVTLQELQESVNTAYQLVMRAEEAGGLSRAELREIEDSAHAALLRASRTLDLAEVPPARRVAVGIEAALEIKEILDRLPLNPVETIPGARAVAEYRDSSRNSVPFRWQVPNTELEIVEVRDGENSGKLLFSGVSVRRADEYLARISDLPYRRDNPEVAVGYVSPETSPGFHAYYISTPGYLLPRATTFGSLVEGMPSWMTTVRGGQAIFQWIGLILCIGLLTIAALLLFRIIYRVADRLSNPMDDWIRIAAPLATSLLVRSVVEFADASLNITGDLLGILVAVGGTVKILLYALVVYLLVKAVAESVLAWRRSSGAIIDEGRLRVGSQVAGFFAAAWVIVSGARNLGADIVPLLAGLGIGGLAVALAAQKTIANFLGSMILLANKPVQEGDFVGFGDKTGTVEKIGLHSTVIRTLSRTRVTIPNANFSEFQLENFGARDNRLLQKTLALSKEITVPQLQTLLVAVREILEGNPKVLRETVRARFVGDSQYSKDIEVFAYIDCTDYSEFLEVQESLLLAMEDAVVAAGTTLAKPGFCIRGAGE